MKTNLKRKLRVLILSNPQPMECLKSKWIFLTCMIWAHNGRQPLGRPRHENTLVKM